MASISTKEWSFSPSPSLAFENYHPPFGHVGRKDRRVGETSWVLGGLSTLTSGVQEGRETEITEIKIYSSHKLFFTQTGNTFYNQIINNTLKHIQNTIHY